MDARILLLHFLDFRNFVQETEVISKVRVIYLNNLVQ